MRNFQINASLKKELGGWIFLIPSLLLFIFFQWQPLISGIILSFFKTKGYEAVQFIGLENYRIVLNDSAFLKALINSATYTFWSLLVSFAFPLIIALLINEMVFMNSFFKFATFFPTMVPAMAASLLWLFLYYPGEGGIFNLFLMKLGMEPLQWLQDKKLVIPSIIISMTWRGYGGAVILYLASLQGVNNELYEAAALDGASPFRKVIHVTIPTIMPIIVMLFILQIIGVFQVMAEPLAMTDGGPNNASVSLMLQSYFYAFRYFQAGKSMAVGVITFSLLMLTNLLYFSFKKKLDY